MSSRVLPELGAVLQRLAPPGLAWPKRIDSVARKVLDGLAGRPAELQVRLRELLAETDPRTALELLPDFERLLDLPGDCAAGVVQTLLERRVAVVQKLAALRGATPAELVAVGSALGFEVQVLEYRPFVAGSHAGDVLSNSGWLYTVTVRAPVAAGTFFRVGTSSAGDPLYGSTRATLECLIEEAVPGHVFADFAYDLPADPTYQPWNPATVRPSAFGAVPSVPFPTLAEA